MKYTYTFYVLILVLFVTGCKKENNDDIIRAISGEVINSVTKKPVSDVQVILLENGPVTKTNANGNFHFTEDEATSMQSLEAGELNEANENLAVRLSLEGYLPKEVNITYKSSITTEIVPDSLTTYLYSKPVQRDDGLATSTLLEEQIDTSYIQNLMDKLAAGNYKQLHSLLIYKNDKLVLEEYYYGNNDTIDFEDNVRRDKSPAPIQWSRNEKHYVASVNKALTSTVTGIALDAYGKSVDEKVSTYLPDYEAYFTDDNKNNVTFEHCLTMTTGFIWDEWGSNDLSLLWESDDFADFLLSRDNMGPDSEWRYNSAAPNLLLKCMNHMVDGSIREWADANFYGKLGITDYKWGSQPDGLPEGAARMFIRPRDMLKVGVTYLNDGVWNGEQVIPESWVTECWDVKKETSSGDYSYYFWLRELNGIQYLSADGDGGNYINIFPSLDMVLVITQGNYLEWPLYVNQADDMMKNYILPAVQ